MQNGLAYPPHRIADELETTCLIELFGCFDQAQVAFVDKVGQTQTLVLILFCDRYDETQIGTCQFLQCGTVTLADALGELHLFLDSNEVLTPDFLQILVQRSALAVSDTFGNF